MKRKMILLFFALSLSLPVFPQLYGGYICVDTTQCFPETVDYSLGIGKGHKYELVVDFGNGECFGRKVISRGTLDLVFDTIFLIDEKTGVEMKFIMKEGGSLLPIHAIAGLIGKTFRPFLQYFAEEESPRHKFRGRSLFSVKMSSCYASSLEELLILSNDHKYALSCCDKVVTKGVWKRHGNRLYLTDENLNQPFIGILKKDRLEIFEDEMGKVKIDSIMNGKQ